MCGIAGIYHFRSGNPVEGSRIKRMCDAMVHRGPDGEGQHIDGAIGLGHRRLSVIDLAGGQQPMANEDGSVHVSYNGEIYNFQELRSNLIARGHRFNSRSDTEVLVHGYESFGSDVVPQLNGMFAFALWDAKARRLLLARDRFGVKPVYYAIVDGGTLVFASEVKALLASGLVHPELDNEGLAEHFTFQNNYGDRTLYRGVKLLEPGSVLTCTPDGIRTERYWDFSYELETGRSEAYYVEGLRERFETAVQRQLVSDVSVGSYLSGGMDSGSITAVAAREIRPFHTFTCGFDTSQVSDFEAQFDERVDAELLAKMLDTQHHERHIFANDMVDLLPRVVNHLEDFRVGISYQIYSITELISDFSTVVLSGVGGDELFAGYPWRYEQILGAKSTEDFDDTYYQCWTRFLDDDQKKGLFSGDLVRSLSGFSSRDLYDEVAADAPSDPLNRALYFDSKTFLQGLFVVEDKLSMAHSVETRVPFLDNDLVDFVSKIPPELKFKDGEIKYVLKEAMAGLLPKETLWRRKQGFTPPDQTWYRTNTLEYINDLLLGDRAHDRGLFNPEAVKRILVDHVEGKANHRFMIWSMMCLEWWQRLFIDGDEIPVAAEQSARLAVA